MTTLLRVTTLKIFFSTSFSSSPAISISPKVIASNMLTFFGCFSGFPWQCLSSAKGAMSGALLSRMLVTEMVLLLELLLSRVLILRVLVLGVLRLGVLESEMLVPGVLVTLVYSKT